jgi:hypothetical protein
MLLAGCQSAERRLYEVYRMYELIACGVRPSIGLQQPEQIHTVAQMS